MRMSTLGSENNRRSEPMQWRDAEGMERGAHSPGSRCSEPRSSRSLRDDCAESYSSFGRTLSCSGCRGDFGQHRRRTRAQKQSSYLV